MYLYLSSTDSLTSHPDNTATDFTVDLGRYLKLPDVVWQVALIDISGPITRNAYIYCDLCQSSLIDNGYAPVLRYLTPNNETNFHPTYVDVCKDSITRLRIFIRTCNVETTSVGFIRARNDETASVDATTTRCTLHLRPTRVLKSSNNGGIL